MAPKRSILSALQATSMVESKPVLPAEILASILDYLPVSDMIRFAKTSRRMREMVYDDTRWVARLKSMGCWDELEARRRFEDAMKRKRETMKRASIAGQSPVSARGANTTIFDAALEAERRNKAIEEAAQPPDIRVDGFETLSINAPPSKSPFEDPEALLEVLKNVRSIRGHARQEYGKIYGALAPFYFDLVQAKSHTDPILFRVFRDPERQAQMLANLHTFTKSDWAQGWREREEKLSSMSHVFESAVLREFEQGYEFWDVDGRMKRYAHVLHALNGGTPAIDLFISKHPIFNDREVLANSMDCVNQAARDEITLEPSQKFFDTLSKKLGEQNAVMTRIFPNPATVFWSLVDKVREDIIMDYVTPLLDETHERHLASYLKAASGLFEQCFAFAKLLDAPAGSEEKLEEKLEDRAKETALKVFEPHLDLYLQEELDFFTKHAEREVGNWDQKLSEQDATVESFYMKNFNRQADKNDFLSSFKKVVMMPVTVLPNIPLSSPFGGGKPAPASAANSSSRRPVSITGTPGSSRPQTPGLGTSSERTGTPLPTEAPPTDELKAKAALMASRLEGIKTLFSIEVALDLVHSAKTSLGRAAVFMRLGGQAGGEAREQCEAIFVVLLKILGQSHIKHGFTKAVDHLSYYNPREVSDHNQAGVAPLVTFIELVNVGDLISQMIDVFFDQQMLAPKIADRNDFLDPAGLAKKKFEQMLDESVAAGLNKGIDVLMDEVEYLCATIQLPTDYNPLASSNEKGISQGPDIGPTQTAKRIVELVSSHTNMLVGSTEKTMLDVFNGEVGLRLFTAICKHIKRQRISTDGAIKLIADMNLYFDYIRTLKNNDLQAYFKALRELSQIYLIDAKHAKEMATIIADGDRFGGIFRAEEVYEFAERRADWYQVKRDVERAMYGLECSVM
ncbi:exocyst complex component Sec10-like protein [Pseudomassariella vexata]|uniref:Exocyst complex component Sec10-like protein n=1 Tax=Pseudomassariella vexata TaxID=1141098 RepID=A0A1Y2EKD1_9PEZI|nr:exocyst complex component Sec10-like protein [Pseudomassariella vexata]ORY71990.1 exocyst complex component Sec10-like protein [Pseudomassariella vexata]